MYGDLCIHSMASMRVLARVLQIYMFHSFTLIFCMSSAPQNRFEAVGGKQLQENPPFQGKKLQCAKTTRNKT